MKTEIYSDTEGNCITIATSNNGVYVTAEIRTKPRYSGGPSATAARKYAQSNGLKRQ